MAVLARLSAVRATHVELRRVNLPLVTPFRTSSGSLAEREALLVRVATDTGHEGWGECAAFADPTYTSEYVDGAADVLERFLVPALFARGDVAVEDLGPSLSWVQGHHMAKAALETALLDATLRAEGRSLSSFLGGVRTAVGAGVAVGIAGSLGALLDAVDAYVSQGYRRIKLKVEPGWDIEPVRAVRERFPDLALQVDANGAYSVGDAEHLAALDPFDLLLIEQPLPAHDLVGHAEVARRLRTPICLDESIESADDAAAAIALGACSVVNVKPGRVGGYLEARRVHDVCSAAGVAVWCGGMLETGIGRAANTALAAMPNFTLPGDLSASDRYYARDITEPFVLHDGKLRVPAGPGIGLTPLPDVLAEVTTSVRNLTPSE
jgi:O-succinylbenzoate synthase